MLRQALFASALAALLFVPAHGQDRNERILLHSLESQRISMEFRDAPFDDVIDFIRVTSGINVVVDPVIYRDRTREDLRVTLEVQSLSVRNALELLLDIHRLTWTLKNGVMLITTPEARPLRFSTRVYDIRDLLFDIKDFPGPDISLADARPDGTLGPIFGEPEDVDELEPDMILDIVRENTGVGSWDQPETGIQHVTGFLIVRQSSSVHQEVYKMLNLLRSHR